MLKMLVLKNTEWYLRCVGLADAVQAVESAAGLTTRHHPQLHVAAGEVLQLMVDIQIPDAAMEAGHVEALRGETKRGGHHLLRHPWRHREGINRELLVWLQSPSASPLLLPPTYRGASPVTAWLRP